MQAAKKASKAQAEVKQQKQQSDKATNMRFKNLDIGVCGKLHLLSDTSLRSALHNYGSYQGLCLP